MNNKLIKNTLQIQTFTIIFVEAIAVDEQPAKRKDYKSLNDRCYSNFLKESMYKKTEVCKIMWFSNNCQALMFA